MTTTPHRPPSIMALALYSFPGIMGTLFLLGVTAPIRLTDTTSPGWATAFSVLLLVGSLAAIGGALLALWRPLRGLPVEALGALVIAGQHSAYAVSLVDPESERLPLWTILAASCMAAACLGRAVQALRERQRILRQARGLVRQMSELREARG